MAEVLRNDFDIEEISASRMLLSEFFDNFNSEHTKQAYRRDISGILDFAARSFSINSPTDIKRFHVIQYKEYLLKDCAPKTVNRKLSSVSSFLSFLVEKGLMESNPCTNIRRPRQSVKRETEGLSDEEVGLILTKGLDKASGSYHLHRAILVMFFATGIRRSELIGIKRSDYKKIKEGASLSILAKGGKFLTKLIPPQCVVVIDDYLDHMASIDRVITGDQYLFQPSKNPIGDNNKKMSTTSVRYIISKACKRAGISKRISAHSARASYISAALEGGADMLHVSQDVGHSSVQTTEIYNKRRLSIENSPSLKIKYLNSEE
jgi:site-specific recombinase XerD